MKVTEEQKQLLQRTTWLSENQKQAVSLLQTLSEEEVAAIMVWTLPIIVEVPSTNDVKRQLQARGVAINDRNVAIVMDNLRERMCWVGSDVQRQLEHAIDELEQELKQEAATKA
jgi:hypothetical protein